MKGNFDQALAWIQQDEGGGAVRPDEPGGAVFHGVSLEAYRRYRPNATVDDLMKMPMEDEHAIYRLDYADRIAFDDLPWPVDYVMMNAAVMSGVTAAQKMYIQAKEDDPHHTARNIIVLQMQKMMQKPNVLHFGPGWSNRMVRVLDRIK